jgi:hypothetical protein
VTGPRTSRGRQTAGAVTPPAARPGGIRCIERHVHEVGALHLVERHGRRDKQGIARPARPDVAAIARGPPEATLAAGADATELARRTAHAVASAAPGGPASRVRLDWGQVARGQEVRTRQR